jgi:DNA-binding transcriptional MerR regulator
MDQKEFTSADVIALSGISERQLQWWAERHLLNCRMEGHNRKFTSRDVLRAMVIANMKERGVTLGGMRKLAASIERGIEGALNSASQKFLASDRRTVRLIDSGDCLQSLPEWLRGVFLVPISEFILKVEAHKAGSLKVRRAPRRISRLRELQARQSGEWMRGVTA